MYDVCTLCTCMYSMYKYVHVCMYKYVQVCTCMYCMFKYVHVCTYLYVRMHNFETSGGHNVMSANIYFYKPT